MWPWGFKLKINEEVPVKYEYDLREGKTLVWNEFGRLLGTAQRTDLGWSATLFEKKLGIFKTEEIAQKAIVQQYETDEWLREHGWW